MLPMSDQRDSYHDILYRNIGGARGRVGWSIQHTAAQIGMKRATFSAKLHGDSDFRMRELVRLAAALKVPFSELVKGLDEAEELQTADERQAVTLV